MSEDSNIFYVYEHVRNDTGQVFYVGKGSGRRAYYSSGRNKHWHRIVNKHGFSVTILAREICEELAPRHFAGLLFVSLNMWHT